MTEFRHLTGQVADFSTLTYEYPTAEGDPYYPIPRPENRELYHRYEALAAERPDVLFVGRLARYQYLNMDQVVAQALVAVERWAAERGLRRSPLRGGRMTRPDVIVAWLQNDYGKLGRAGEAIAHSLVRSSARRPRRLRRTVPPGPGRAPARRCATIVACSSSAAAAAPRPGSHEVAHGVVKLAELNDPILLNFGVSEANWWLHYEFAPVCSRTVLVAYDKLAEWDRDGSAQGDARAGPRRS